MHLTEVSLDGVRGVAPSVRLTLTPGYNVLSPQGSEPPPLRALLHAMLHAEVWGEEAHLVAPGGVAKAAVGLLGRDQLLYRVIRHFGGPGILQRIPRGGPAPEALAQDAVTAQKLLVSQIGVPPGDAFLALCMVTPEQRPSARPRPGSDRNGPVGPAEDLEAAQRRAQELTDELALTREVDALQFRSDTLANEVFQAEEGLKGAEGPKAELAEAEAALAGAPDPVRLGLAEDLMTRLQQHPEHLQRREEALQRLASERESEGIEEEFGAGPPPWTEARFWGAVVASLALMIAGAVLGGGASAIALLAIPVSGFPALLGLQYVERLQESARNERRGSLLVAREKKIEEAYQREFAPIAKAMEVLEQRTPEDVLELLERKERLVQHVQALREAVARVEADPENAQRRERYQRLVAEQEAVNRQLSEKGAYVRDLREIEKELERVRTSIELAKRPGAALLAPGDFEDPCPGFLTTAATYLNTEIPAVTALLKDRLAQYVAALTDKRYLGLDFAPTGMAAAIPPAGAPVRVGNLPARDIDLVYLALRLTFAEKVAPRVKLPLIIEGRPAGVDAAKAGLLARMLKHLGTHTQVVHLTGEPSFQNVAEHSATL